MKTTKHFVIVGATSAIAQECARGWVKDLVVEMTLIGRDRAKTERVSQDLQVRSPQSIFHVLADDFVNPKAIQHLVDRVAEQRAVDTVLIAHGALADQADCQKDVSACQAVLEITGVSPVLYAEAFAEVLERQGRGTLALISSVAGDRGRKTNYVYGAAKSLVSCYAEGLQHRFAGSNVKIFSSNQVQPTPQ